MIQLFLWAILFSNYEAAKLQETRLHPVILVPGDGGSQMDARLNKTSKVSYFCELTADWYTLWLEAEELIPLTSSCWMDNIKLVYNQTDRTTKNNDGVDVRVPGFGNTSTVEYLNPSKSSYAIYFGKVVDELLTLGYQRGVNIHGAPYDFRRAPNEHREYFKNLTDLVEKTYTNNGNSPVIFICHSMGSPMTLYFLHSKSDAWKEKYIRAFVTLAGVWGGTVRALKVYLLGDNLGSYFVDSSNIGLQERTNPSLAWLMPKDWLWTSDEIILQSSNINITTKNFPEVYNGLNHTDGLMMWQDTKDLLDGTKPPNVEMFCIHGNGVPSVERLVYKSQFPGSSASLVTGDGDGTVNIRSLEACLNWRTHQKQKVYHHIFKGVDHGQILKDPESAEYIRQLVVNITKNITPESQDIEVNFKSLKSADRVSTRLETEQKPSPLNIDLDLRDIPRYQSPLEHSEDLFNDLERKIEDTFEPIIELIP